MSRQLRIAVSGASGLVGSALVPALTGAGHRVLRLVRRPAETGSEIGWEPNSGRMDLARMAGIDVVIHLAGENLSEGRWNAQKKARIRDSRVQPTRRLSETLASIEQPPRLLISASAVGYYGNRGGAVLREDSPPGRDFLASVCRDWEAATEPASAAGIRVVNPRFGPVLSPRGGALAAMVKVFRTGIGGSIGSGQQWVSWVAIDDAIGALLHFLTCEELSGPVNVVAPQPVQNERFSHTLGRVMGRPSSMKVPAFAARMAFGEVADAVLMASQRVEPARLLASGFAFRFPELEPALRHLLAPAPAR
jgi:uncharacterized protein